MPADRQSWMPSADIIETGGTVRIKADLAGMDPKDIHLEVEDNVLTLSGERRFEEEVHEDKYYRIERRYGSFQRSLALPQGVDADSIQAHYENGVLEVTIPKMEQVKPRRIPVESRAPRLPRWKPRLPRRQSTSGAIEANEPRAMRRGGRRADARRPPQ